MGEGERWRNGARRLVFSFYILVQMVIGHLFNLSISIFIRSLILSLHPSLYFVYFFGPPFILVIHSFFEFLLFSSFSFFVSFFFVCG